MTTDESFNDWWIGQCFHKLYETVFFDVDGTLLGGDRRAVPGAAELIGWLRRHGKPFKLITNDGNHSLAEKARFLKKAGLEFKETDIISCSQALIPLSEERGLKGKRMFVMGDLGKPVNYAEEAGLVVETDPEKIDDCEGVIVGEGDYDWQRIFSSVHNFLRRRHGKALFVAPNPDSYWPDGHGGLGIGAGAIARFLRGLLAEEGIFQELHLLGKPYRAVFDFAIREVVREYGLKEAPEMSSILMLGDFLPSDIRGANELGMTSVLMLTGVTRVSQLQELSPDLRPAYVFRQLQSRGASE